MRPLPFVAACVLALLAHDADAVGTYSDGYRMGLLSKWSVKGLVVKSAEGELLLGSDSSTFAVKGKDGKPDEQVNPWAFSSDRATYDRYRDLIGDYVFIHYRQLLIQVTNWTGDTDYRVLDVERVNTEAPPPEPCGQRVSRGGVSDGDRVGRIVKASTKGNIAKSYEVIFQLGNAGNQFLEMSITDDDIYACAVNFLKSGRRVRLTYHQTLLRNPLTRDTTYNIVGIEALRSLD
jgi:hypothetical protein